jgi:hypothetical protein
MVAVKLRDFKIVEFMLVCHAVRIEFLGGIEKHLKPADQEGQ